jgi:monovalent cation:H+ antiporter-2, CPA2 family
MGIASDFVLIVVAGLGGAILARMLGLPLLVGYVAAGVVVGPYTGGPMVAHVDDIELLAEIGVALLLFALGLEFSFRDLRAVRRVALVATPIQIGLTACFGALLARTALHIPTTDAIWFGAMISLSSTMVVLKTLAADGTTATLASRVMIGMLVVQDLAVVPMLVILPSISNMTGAVPRLARASLVAAGFLLAVVLVGTWLLPALLRRIVRWGSRELFLVAVVAAGVGIGYLTYRLGLSFAIGAFVAGLVLSESELRHQALSDVAPLRDMFGLLFFVSVGMLFDPRYVADHAGQVALVVVVIVVGKALICGLLARAFGYGNMAPWIVGLGLSQIGEFSFVLARTGRTGGFIARDTYDLALTSTVLSMALAPVVFSRALPLARAWARWYRPAQPSTALQVPRTGLENHVVVAGYGRTGRAVADTLQRAAVPYLVVELSHEALAGPLEQGLPVVWGDISSEDILRAAGILQARMLVMAVPEWQAIRLGIDRAKALNPRLFVIARATTVRHVEDLRGLHADVVVQPEFEGGVEMVRQALRQCERSGLEIDQLTTELRKALYQPLDL